MILPIFSDGLAHLTRLGGAGLLAVLLGTAGCSEEVASTPGPVATFCTDGTSTCIGNIKATCTDGGKAYKATPCGTSKYCLGAECQGPVKCEKASLSCDGNKVMRCPDDGAGDPTQVKACTTGNVCVGGECLPKPCTTEGEIRCGWRALLTCTNGIWKAKPCDKGLCDAKTKACVANACEPTAAQCKSGTVTQVCTATGSAWTEKACPGGQTCEDGLCHPIVQGKEPDGGATTLPDTGAGSGDTGSTVNTDTGGFLDIPKKEIVFEPNDVFKVIISESNPPPAGAVATEFDIASANYLEGMQLLQIGGDLDQTKIEIDIKPIEDFAAPYEIVAGAANSPETVILMNDGTNDQATLQWKFGSSDYTINLTAFEDKGGRVKGTFSAEMTDATDKKHKIYLLDGYFDIKRK